MLARAVVSLLLSLVWLLPAVAQQDPSASDIPEDKKIIRFQSEFGIVNFYHYLHATLRANSCESCHHTLKEDGGIKSCHECHLPEAGSLSAGLTGTPRVAEAFHVKCKGCHQYTTQVLFERAGPVTCKLCHLGKEHLEAPEKHPR